MRPLNPSLPSGKVIGGLALSILASMALLSWFGYHAILEWRRSSLAVADRRAAEAADLLLEALTRDMRGVQQEVLTSPAWGEFAPDRPYELSNFVASAFARYPYPESFFVWRGESGPNAFVFFNRSNRRPAWMPSSPDPTRFPVVVGHEPNTATQLQNAIQRDAAQGRRFSAFELSLGDADYQIVAQLTYRDPFREHLAGVAGFMTNLDWVHDHYFSDLTRQVAEIGGGAETGLDMAVADPQGRALAGSAVPKSDARAPIHRRAFSLLFFDPLAVTLPSDQLSKRGSWYVAVSAANDVALTQAVSGANRTLIIGAASILMLAVGLMLTAWALRANARLVELRSDFVSSVTHELKTPISTIRAAAETLSGGRLTGSEAFQSYGRLVAVEAKRLTRLVENLLAYSRVTDVANLYSFETIDLADFFEDLQRDFQSQLDDQQFEFCVEMPAGIPLVRGDRLALRLLFDNVVDNSLRYSKTNRRLEVGAKAEDGFVRIAVTDFGVGIPEDELADITRKFVRGRSALSGGSGLGLAIATRVARDHGGQLHIQSTLGKGTTVTVTLPIA